MDKELKEIMQKDMLSLPFVKWDRFLERDNGATIFGWIDREDSYKDFVYFSYEYNSVASKKSRVKTWEMSHGTSSAKYSKEITTILTNSDEHSDCQRAENVFDVPNLVKNKKEEELPPNSKVKL